VTLLLQNMRPVLGRQGSTIRVQAGELKMWHGSSCSSEGADTDAEIPDEHLQQNGRNRHGWRVVLWFCGWLHTLCTL
jgi:hypothetical protein